jgi:uncharacterized protein (DUF58 family)
MKTQHFTSRTAQQPHPSVLTTVLFLILCSGLALIATGVLLLLIVPFLLAAGLAVVIFALIVFILLALLEGVRRSLRSLGMRLGRLHVGKRASPWLTVILRYVAHNLVSLLIQWLDQQEASRRPGSHTSPPPSQTTQRSRKRKKRRRPALIAAAS